VTGVFLFGYLKNCLSELFENIQDKKHLNQRQIDNFIQYIKENNKYLKTDTIFEMRKKLLTLTQDLH
jgi:hypothetical protein